MSKRCARDRGKIVLVAILVTGPVGACGGGGGSSTPSPPTSGVLSPAPTPVPPTAPTPTPPTSPAPTPPPTYLTLPETTSDFVFRGMSGVVASAFTGFLPGTILEGRENLRLSAAGWTDDAGISFSFGAASASYALTFPGEARTFGEREATETPVSYTDRVTGEILHRPGYTAINALLRYVRGASWSTPGPKHIEPGVRSPMLEGQDIRTRYFNYGYDTVASDMPQTGLRSYRSQTVFTFFDDTHRYGASGQFSLVVNFATGAVTGSITTDQLGSTAGVERRTDLQVEGRIVPGTNRWTGTVASRDLASQGPLSGRFYGPSATEVGATFHGIAGVALAGFLNGLEVVQQRP